MRHAGMRDFYVTLPSSAGGGEFPNNNPNHFKVWLHYPLHFQGSGWKVGLSSISLTDAQVNLYDLVPKVGYLMHCTWDANDTLLSRKGSTSIMMDDVDHLESAVDGEARISLIEAR